MKTNKQTSFLQILVINATLSGCINYTNTDSQISKNPISEDKYEQKKTSVDYVDFRDSFKEYSIKDSLSKSEIQNPTYSIEINNEQNKSYLRTIEYNNYAVLYNVLYKIPVWVKYELTALETDGPHSRKGKDFRQDQSMNYPQADDNDYKGSGWSRGHMAPSGDFKWDNDAMWDTFYYINSGQWNSLEQKVRNWARQFGSITVVTGPIIGDNKYGTIGYNKIVVPDAFFKAILADRQAIAFVMYNQPKNEKIPKCAMSIDSLEELVGVDFFSELDDDIESEIESSFIPRHWNL